MSESRPGKKALIVWLSTMCALVAAMIMVGGATRLTDSGLSITEWDPIMGAIPPLSHEAWVEEFEKYQTTTEFQQQNYDMTLKEFEVIYYWEWGHRLLGRLIGLAFALPFIFFLIKGWIPKGRRLRYLGLFILGAMQAVVGWWMVASGLQDRLDVSQHRLAVHLGLAFLILGALFWTLIDESRDWKAYSIRDKAMPKLFGGLAVLVFVQIIAGAFVAGTDAGWTYNTWPLMDGGFVPSGYDLNAFENIAAIQFNHRILAYLLFGVSIYALIRSIRTGDPVLKRAGHAFAGSIFMQVIIGIVTLVMVVPLYMGLMHQGWAIVVWLIAIWAFRRQYKPA